MLFLYFHDSNFRKKWILLQTFIFLNLKLCCAMEYMLLEVGRQTWRVWVLWLAVRRSVFTNFINVNYLRLHYVNFLLGQLAGVEENISCKILDIVTNLYKHVQTENLIGDKLFSVLCVDPFLQSTELMSLSAAVSHFLNCFLSSCPVPQPHPVADEVI